MAARLLLIEDDVTLCEIIRLALTKKDLQVEVAYDATTGLQKAYATSPHLILLDILLANGEGWRLCGRLREMSDVPIMILTAQHSETVVQGLELGADAYIVKPVPLQELLARVRALLRRVPHGANPRGESQVKPLTYDNVVIDSDKREVIVDGKRIDLSPIEYRLLCVLMRHMGRTLPHEYLLREVWGPDYVDRMDYLRLYVSYLRRKIEKDPSKPSLIQNDWGSGYRFG